MTVNNDPQCLPHVSEAKHIRSILSSNNLEVRDERKLTRGMIAAVQPLAIDGKEIFTDTLLAELVTYKTADQMMRETETLTLKKAAFGAFESSMTPIPKYCFKNIVALTTVLVHSVPRFTLDDILNAGEKKYPRPYTHERLSFYTDWIKSVIGRIRRTVKPGGARLIRMAVELPKRVFPEPPRIAQLERKTFAALILRAVEQHHRAGVYHDCISERTVFFPTPYQPLVFSNYSGVPSAMLSDLIPPELMADEAAANYGPQCRDIYCLALICYRIMTGETHDGRRFTLESPRPPAVVAGEIARRAGLSVSFKNPVDAKRSIISLFKAAGGIISLLPPLFSRDAFVAWRKINRATGGLWRSIPAVGPFCDIFVPTQSARTLRYILDKPWFTAYFFRKGSPSGAPDSRGPDIATLIAAFTVRRPPACPRFESALNALISESALKRQAFGSMMESILPVKKTYRLPFPGKRVLIFTAIALVVAALSIALRHGRRKATGAAAGRRPVWAAVPSVAGQTSPAITPPIEEKPATAILPPVKDTNARGDGPVPVVGKKPPLPKRTSSPTVNGNRPIRSATAAVRGKKTAAAGRTGPESMRKHDDKTSSAADSQESIPAPAPEISPAYKGTLHAAIGYRDVFIVTGLTDSCNPGRLYYSRGGKKDTVMMSRLPAAAPKLFMVHRSSTGFGSIKTIRLCRNEGCDRTMYFEAVGANGIGKPVYVETGDVIGLDRTALRLFIKARQALYKK
ncbi:MAG: hypothetical protein JW913_15805 [Chitinispirillaceae bacterium]|nr:hypothetical protein [Chitinispirillaceae bacterium]